MASSDSEDFESADEGSHDGNPKKERKKRLSSSHCSDSVQETDQKEPSKEVLAKTAPSSINKVETADGWEDFDVEYTEPEVNKTETGTVNKNESEMKKNYTEAENNTDSTKSNKKQQDIGWDEFDDWGEDKTSIDKTGKQEPQPKCPSTSSEDIKSVADRLSAASVSETKVGGGWGWGGWGVDSILSTATAGITSITSQVSHGISTVLETGIGAPDPEELARKNKDTKDLDSSSNKDNAHNLEKCEASDGDQLSAGDNTFQLGSLISGVTKFVETTGTKVIVGGLDTLETIGKKTMEVLQDGDPGLAKKRAMLGLDAGDKPVLSQLLKEAKARADEEDRIKEEKREAKQVHYETLFDDFEGLVHLEALEMLSKQVSMRIEERLRSADLGKRQEIRETLQQVAELCEMPDDDDEDTSDGAAVTPDSFHDRLQEATQDLGLKLHFHPLVKQYTEELAWLQSPAEMEVSARAVLRRAVGGLAHCTALAVQLYHKCAEMLLVKGRRSTADEADAMAQMTGVLTRHISDLATRFTDKLNSLPTDDKEHINTYITNVFLEAGNSSTYIQNAFQLTLPILQIGAA